MGERLSCVLAALMTIVATSMTAVPSLAFDGASGLHIPADPRGPGAIPTCDHARVLKRIVNQQAYADRRTWKTGIRIDGFERYRENAFQPKTVPGTIGRRYCQAHALLTNGTHPQVYYLIEERQGFASIGWNVEFCMPGHDKWHVYDARCRTLRPYF